MIGQEGKNLGVLATEEALRLAREAGMDLIEISPAAKKQKDVEIKSVRIGIGTSLHDMELKAQQADEFLKDGNKIKIDLALRGREKYLDRKFLEGRIERFLAIVSQNFQKEDVKKGPRGLSLTVGPKK